MAMQHGHNTRNPPNFSLPIHHLIPPRSSQHTKEQSTLITCQITSSKVTGKYLKKQLVKWFEDSSSNRKWVLLGGHRVSLSGRWFVIVIDRNLSLLHPLLRLTALGPKVSGSCWKVIEYPYLAVDPAGRSSTILIWQAICNSYRQKHIPSSSPLPSRSNGPEINGKATGLVTNTRVSHATPAALYAHSASRYWEDDAKVPPKARKTCKDITRQLIEDEPGRNINVGEDKAVVLGGGRRHWLPKVARDPEQTVEEGRRLDGRNLIDDWLRDKKKRGLKGEYVWNKQQMDTVNPAKTDYLLGLFAYSHMEFEAERDQRSTGDPSLAEMTTKALKILMKNPNGFFLFVESGRIDHAHHYNNPYRALDETLVLDDTVLTVLSTVNLSDTLLVLTSDHSHVLTLGGLATPRGNPILVRGHSFTQCDRNFSLVRAKIKQQEVIGRAKPWLQAIVEARQNPSPFQVIVDRDLIKQWDECLSPYFDDISKSAKKLQFTIIKYVMIKYKTCGSVLCFSSFLPNYKPFKFLLNTEKAVLMHLKPKMVPFPKVSETKLADVRGLMKHLPLDDRDWLEVLFDEAN
ncbi:hypothetical protein J6590_077099 [Homalodisca vitripennis]|nr:hypothetical protein J6590_077099 [Homalodisca vitripennis]